MDDDVPATFEDGSTKTIPGKKRETYTAALDGTSNLQKIAEKKN